MASADATLNKDAAYRLKMLLRLDDPPIAMVLKRGGNPPTTQKNPIPACMMWGTARTQSVEGSANDHFGCPQGAEIVGFKLPPDMEDAKCAAELLFQKTVYGLDESVEACPRPSETMPLIRLQDLSSIEYGPLDKYASRPDVVLIMCNAYQAMTITEIFGREAEKNVRFLSGFPACAVVAGAYCDQKMYVTLGCEYSRLFTPLEADKLFVAFPGSALTQVVEGVERVVNGVKKIRSMIQAGGSQFRR